jgi:hypothetical protein
LKDDAAKLLAECLAKNSRLQEVRISQNNCTESYKSKIEALARRNSEKARRNIVPQHLNYIRSLKNKASKFDEVQEKLNE